MMLTCSVKLIRLLLVLVLALCVYGKAYSANSFIYASDGQNMIAEADVFIDKTNQRSFDDIRDADATGKFKRLYDTYEQVNNDYTYWYKLEIAPTVASTESWLQIDPAWLDYVTLYQERPDGSYLKQISGKYVDPLVKPFSYRFPLFKLALRHGEPTVIYLQVKTRVGQLLMIRFWNPALFMQHESKVQFAWGIYFGVSFLLIIASIWFERVIRDGVYVAFSAYVLCAAVLNFAVTGWWYEWLYAIFGIFFFPVITLSILWLVYTGTLFALKFLNIHKTRPKMYRVYLRFTLIYVCIYSCLMFTPLASKAIQVHYIISIVLFFPLITCILAKPIWQSHYVIRRILILICFIILASTFISILSLLHILPYNDYIASAPTVSLLIPFLLIFYTLSKRYQMLREENDRAEKQLFEMTKNSAQELKQLVSIKTKDLSDAKIKIEQSLYAERQAYQEQRNFIAMVSHEFRTPLAIIDATLQNLLRLKENQSIQPKLQKIERSTERLTALMTHYLSQDRLNIFLKGMKSDWFELNEIVNAEKGMANTLFVNHPVTVNIPQATKIWGDKDIIKLVLNTLIENAVKYTPPLTPIRLEFHQTDTVWQIDVIDFGPGVGDEHELIFEKFYRARTSSNQVGTGLGLTLARNLMHMQGGDLTLEHMPVSGCCFRITIPFPDPTAAL